MWERVKTSLLLVLIVVSFQLTRMFWMQVGTQVSLVVSPGVVGPSLPIGETTPASYMDLYAPLHIYVHQGTKHYQLRTPDRHYAAVWSALKSALTQLDGSDSSQAGQFASVGLTEWQKALSNSLEMRYSGPIELNYWWLASGKSSIWRFSEQPLFFDRIVIPLQDNCVFFRNLETDQVWRWQWSTEPNAALLPGTDQLSFDDAQRLEVLQVPEGIAAASYSELYTYRAPIFLPEILVAPPFRTADKPGIIRQFFSITPRVPRTNTLESGEVVESLITAKQQVLSLSNTGRLEYTETESGGGSSTITEQFELAFNFIDAHGGWPRAVLADGIKQVGTESLGYEFSFTQLHQGYPLIDLNPSTLKVQVAPDGVKSYLRKIYRIVQPGYFPYEIRSSEQALQAVSEELGSRQVTDIYLGYYQRDFVPMNSEKPFDSDPTYLFPVWVIRLNTREHLLVHAFNLMNDPGVIQPYSSDVDW